MLLRLLDLGQEHELLLINVFRMTNRHYSHHSINAVDPFIMTLQIKDTSLVVLIHVS